MSEQSYTKVRDVMTPDPTVIDRLASVEHAIELMRKNNVSSLVIERRQEGDEYGMVTVHDIAGSVLARNRSTERTSVYEIMSKPVLSVDVNMDIKYAMRLLTRFRLNRALVTDQGAMVGIVTLRDMTLRYSAKPT